ncbi:MULTISPECIES: hypothetical protein [Chitinophagaceae]|uniref:hypothetical protein n=1 Tax=Chitinophagaceae TaxID=563835 RepID=UPI000DEFF6A0|nr:MULTISPECIES: hypothetical protein [Chitinophagaceae]RPD50975.1 hypothetical protein DRJ53_05645 [Paracnuella aquatica]
MANRLVTPMLRERLHTLIIQGSDSLYRYELGNLKANFFGGNVTVENLRIDIDSSHYRRLDAAHALPSLTMELQLQRGYISGLSVFRLLFSKRIEITEIGSKEANVRLSRHVRPNNIASNAQPLWKMLQPAIRSIQVDRINLDGIKLLYANADTSESVQLQFDRCVAQFNNVRVDSAAAADTSRIVFTKNITLRFADLSYRTPDSLYNMAAEQLYYSSGDRYLELANFTLQPTLDLATFYKTMGRRMSRYEVTTNKAYFTNLRLDRFIHDNIIVADSAVVVQPDLEIYLDKTLPPEYVSKLGTYPHQRLLHAPMAIDVRTLHVKNGDLSYTERGEKTDKEGTLTFRGTNLLVNNVTNLPARIQKDPLCVAQMNTNILENSPLEAHFTFYLDSADGEWAVSGRARNVTAAQLNTVAMPLGNTELTSGKIDDIKFALRGDSYRGYGRVEMRYSNMAVILRTIDDETGALKTKKLLTKLLNKFTLYPSNPGPDGVVRHGNEVVYARPSNQSFFATIWKTMLKGMQEVMLKSGVYE